MPTKYVSRGRVPVITRGPKRPISKHQKYFNTWATGTTQIAENLLEENNTPQTLIRCIGNGTVYSTTAQTVAVCLVRVHDNMDPQDISIAQNTNLYPSGEDLLWSQVFQIPAGMTEPIVWSYDVKGKRKLKKNDQVALLWLSDNATAPVIRVNSTVFCKN